MLLVPTAFVLSYEPNLTVFDPTQLPKACWQVSTMFPGLGLAMSLCCLLYSFNARIRSGSVSALLMMS